MAHRAKGGRAVFVKGGRIVAAEGDRETIVAPLDRVPLTHQGRIGFQVENTLASTAGEKLGKTVTLEIRDGKP